MSSDLATLKLKVDVLRRLIRMLRRRRTEQTVTAARLLAHQQARHIRLRAELARKDAGIQRLRGVLRDIQGCEEQGRCDHLPPGDHAGVIRAVLGEEVRDDAL